MQPTRTKLSGVMALLALGAAACGRTEQQQASQPGGAPTVRATALPAGAQGPSNNVGAPVAPKRTANVRGPVPTNDWWSSLVFQRYPDNPYSENMHAQPLSMRAKASGLGIAYPATHVITPDNRKYEHTYTEDFTLGVAGLNSPDAKLDGYSDWTVRSFWSGGGASLTTTFGHGLPYVYATKTGGDIRIVFNGAPGVWSNAGNVVGVSIRGHHYGLFAPSGATWRVEGNTLISSLAGKNYVSVAALPDNAGGTLSEFARHAFAFVTDTRVSYSVQNGTVNTTFTATTTPMEGSETRPLMALYRHQWLNSGAVNTGYTYTSARGSMRVLRGNSFSTSLRFGGVLPTLPDRGTYDRNRLAGYLNEAAARPAITGTDTYWVGKSLGRAAELTHIASQLGNTGAQGALLGNMKTKLQDWLTPGGENYFAYDDVWGTLIGYPASYGSDTELNDHHFHYGYFVQAAAAIAMYDPAWANTWAGQINDLIMDAANPGSDTRFPRLRNFDPYAGHSWASGHAGFASGNNNESSSEAINFATGLILWGSLTNNAQVRDLGIYLYATEVSAIEQYWFDVDNAVYPSNFIHPAVGMNWGDGGSYSTWFTAEPEMIQGINFLPIQHGSLHLGSRPDYIRTNYAHMTGQNGGEPGVWQDIWWGYLALSDPAAAIQKFDANQGYTPEEGQSKAFTYHWIHNLNALGRPDVGVTSNSATAATFNKNGTRTYVAYNPGGAATTVTFSTGATLNVPARSLATSSGGVITNPPPAPTLQPGSFYSLRTVTPGVTRYLRHAGSLASTEVVDANSAAGLKQDASWKAAPGLADAGCVSFESVNFPGSYLRHAGSRLRIDPNNTTDLFRQDATFCVRAALDRSGGNVSLASKNFPNSYIRHRGGEVWLDPNDNSAGFRADASWAPMSAWSTSGTTPPPPAASANIPGVVTTNAGAIANGASRSWNLNATGAANLRLRLTSNSTQNSRSITVVFAGREIPLSINAGQTVNVDFAGVGAGAQTLTLRAGNDAVSLGQLEFVTY
ncbi:glycosyl hydrolase [Deinococcus sp. YIM 134068]|uniref:glycosyl hydrolase n=1 Tax=Deinococcus lichenicola TaxID=3118910 RepID=UPI002F95E349